MIVAANKADNEKRELEAAEFHALGWEETYAISATHGRGIGDLLDAIVWALPPESEAELARKARETEAEAWAEEVAPGRLEPFVVGDPRPATRTTTDGVEAPDLDGVDAEAANGTPRWPPKRTMNRPRSPSSGGRTSASRHCSTPCSGEDRAIVSEVPGTTRDAIDTRLAWGRSEVVLIDTAGIRRRGKVAGGPAAERYSTLRALHALSRADVAVLVIDAVEGLTAQDAHIAGYVVEEGKGLVVAVNKWDLVEEKTDRTFDQYVEWIRNEAPFLDFAPVISISAKTGQRVGRVLEAAIDIWGERRKRVSTGELNRVLSAATERHAAAGREGPPPEALLRDAGRGRAADVRVLRPRRRRRSISATGATSRTGCARRSASTGRRSGSSSASAIGPAAAPQEADGAAAARRRARAASRPAAARGTASRASRPTG